MIGDYGAVRENVSEPACPALLLDEVKRFQRMLGAVREHDPNNTLPRSPATHDQITKRSSP